MEMPRGRALALSAAGGILAAASGCTGAPAGPATPPPMPEYPPPIGKPAPSASARAHADEDLTDTLRGAAADRRIGVRQARACCKGTNDCKGKGNCKTDKNGCKGHNDCKGQGGCKPIKCP